MYQRAFVNSYLSKSEDRGDSYGPPGINQKINYESNFLPMKPYFEFESNVYTHIKTFFVMFYFIAEEVKTKIS